MVSAQEVNGVITDTIRWTIDETELLTISRTGKIQYYDYPTLVGQSSHSQTMQRQQQVLKLKKE